MIELSEELLLRMYYKMNQARYFEEKLDDLFQRARFMEPFIWPWVRRPQG